MRARLPGWERVRVCGRRQRGVLSAACWHSSGPWLRLLSTCSDVEARPGPGHGGVQPGEQRCRLGPGGAVRSNGGPAQLSQLSQPCCCICSLLLLSSPCERCW